MDYINVFDDLLDDLTLTHYHDLITYLWVNKYPITRANIKEWRERNRLPV